MANMFLSFASTNELRISVLRIGPTEARIFFILVNTAIIILGTGWVSAILPLIVGFLIIALIWVVFRTQKYIWTIDMEGKGERVGVRRESRPPHPVTGSPSVLGPC